MGLFDYTQDTLETLGSVYGFRTTSTIRTPEENKAAKGVWNSQHMTGTARDYSIRGKTTTQIEEFLGKLKEYGFEAFKHKAEGGVEHIHAELPNDPAEGCPSWIPKTLCGGYKNIQKFSDLVSPGAKAAGDFAEEEVGNWTSWAVRVGLFGIALILIAVALVYAFKDSIPTGVVGTAIKAAT